MSNIVLARRGGGIILASSRMSSFELNSSFKPSGDQEQAIGKLLKSLEAGNKHQGLLGVTGSGKTFTMANLIARMNRPTLVISHNKTLAAQLHSELKSFFPNNAVDYYVPISTITSRRRTSPVPTLISRRIPPSMTSWTA